MANPFVSAAKGLYKSSAPVVSPVARAGRYGYRHRGALVDPNWSLMARGIGENAAGVAKASHFRDQPAAPITKALAARRKR